MFMQIFRGQKYSRTVILFLFFEKQSFMCDLRWQSFFKNLTGKEICFETGKTVMLPSNLNGIAALYLSPYSS